MARRAIEVTQSDLTLIEKLAGLGLTLDAIASVVGWSPATLDRKLATQSVGAAYQRGRVLAAQMMSSRLWDIAMSNDEKGTPTKQATAACIFWLKAQAGWSDRLVVDVQQDLEQVMVYLPDNGRGSGCGSG